MAFLNKLRSLPLPPVKNVIDVAMQTARQTMPGDKKKSEYQEPQGAGAPPPVPPRPQSVRFADQEGMTGYTETHELNPFGNPNDFVQNSHQDGRVGNTSFVENYQGYQQGGDYPQR